MSIFADTSFFLALFNRRDAHHARAREFAESNREPLILTTAIIVELGNALSKPHNRRVFLRVLELIESSKVEVVPMEQVYERGIALFRRRMDQDWSMTDCIFFALMAQRGITMAASADRDFQQAKYRALLRENGESS